MHYATFASHLELAYLANKEGERDMKCKEIMTKDPVCCLPDDEVQKAAKLMKDEDVGVIPIIEDEETKSLLGIVTDRDLALRVVAEGRDVGSTRIKDVMTIGAVSCRPDDDLQKALDAMEENQVRRIPVVDNNRKIVGIIAQADVATRISEPQKTAAVVEEISKSQTAGI